MPPPPDTQTTDRVVSLPLSASKWVNLRGSFPLTEKEWTQMKAVLEVMKPGLVTHSIVTQGVRTDISVEIPKSPLTQEAQDLLAKIETSGIPMYVSPNLERIATENGVEVTPQTLPNEIIERLKAKTTFDE